MAEKTTRTPTGLVASSVDSGSYEHGRLKAVHSAHRKKILEGEKRELAKAADAARNPVKMVYRTVLPATMLNRKEISFWNILKSCIGKDLTKIVFPVVLNEPISMIQRLSEYMEYGMLLDAAARVDNPIERCELLAGFVTSTLACNWMRSGKPFNAMLGETFEMVRPDLGFQFVGEQVSHHPPVTALHAEGKGYDFHGSIAPRLTFSGKSIDVTPKGNLVIDLHKYNETYSWQNVHCFIHNIIMGETWMELCGQMTISCNKSDICAVLTFKESGWFHKDLHFVEGHICKGKKVERAVYGSWVKGMYSCTPEAYDKFQKDTKTRNKVLNELKVEAEKFLDKNAGLPVLDYNFQIPGQRVLWQANKPPPGHELYYNFSHFTMALNQMPPPESNISLPPTDSRYRPDQRLFENGNTKDAETEKVRMEMQQRQRRSDNAEPLPLWFTWQRLESTGKEDWVFDRSYWRRDWSRCPNVF